MRKYFAILLAFTGSWILLVACAGQPGEREFNSGVRELKRGQYVRAKTLLEKSISLRPGSDANALAYNYLGLADFNLGLAPEAQEAFENSRRLSPLLADPVYNLGVLLAANGDAARATRVLGEAALIDPSDTRALEYLGSLHVARKQWPEARRALYAALDRSPQSARILTAIANIELGAGAPDQAVVTLMKALEKNSRYAPALFNLAVIYQTTLKDEAQAASYFDKFVRSADGDDEHVAYARAAMEQLRGATPSGAEPVADNSATSPAVASSTATAVATTAPPVAASAEDVLNQAVKLADKGKTQLALEVCLQVAANAERAGNLLLQEKALRTATRICFDQARAHYELGRFLLARKKPEAALKSFKQAIILDGKYTKAQIAMAEAAVQSGEMDAALSGLRQAVQGDPQNADALYALAVLYDRHLDVPEKGAKTYADFATKFPKDARSAQARARAKELLPSIQFPEYLPVPTGTTEVTVTARVVSATAAAPRNVARQVQYKKPASRNTRSAVQAFNRGNYYQEQGKWDDAINFYLRSLESDDQLSSTWYNLGAAYTVKRDFELAKDSYLHALALQPSLDNARYNLALLYREQNDPASAIALLKEVIKNKPDHASAHYVLGYLYAENASTVALARQHYKEFLRLAPKDPSARAVQQWLESPERR